jgi:hypothetical protein
MLISKNRTPGRKHAHRAKKYPQAYIWRYVWKYDAQDVCRGCMQRMYAEDVCRGCMQRMYAEQAAEVLT